MTLQDDGNSVVDHAALWELPDETSFVGSSAGSSFSIVRVATAVLVAAIVILPTVYVLETKGMLGGSEVCELPGHGSGTRAASSFDLANATVPQNEIRAGGPPKDGIPAISDPKMIDADEASYLEESDRVIGVVDGDQAKAYPLAILNYHEIVNDKLNSRPIAITYCPLCDSAAVFDRTTPRGVREFGVSGLLYNSNVLMYDRDDEAESLWSQLTSVSVAGEQVGERLSALPLELTTWGEWKSRYPSTTVMSDTTGYKKDYARNPYGNYFSSSQLMFPVDVHSDRLPTKARVLGVRTGEAARAYPRSSFSADRPRVEDELDGKRIVIEFSPMSESLRVVEADTDIEWMYSLWFSWYALHPETDVFQAASEPL